MKVFYWVKINPNLIGRHKEEKVELECTVCANSKIPAAQSQEKVSRNPRTFSKIGNNLKANKKMHTRKIVFWLLAH